MTIKRVSVWDMDGTIVSSLHRYRTMPCGTRIDLEHWRENCIPEKIMADSLLPLAEQYRNDIADPECFVIIATARQMIDADFRFIREKLGEPDHIIYRKEGDNQSGVTLKVKGLQRYFNLKQFMHAAFTMYEDNGAQLIKICNHFKGRMLGVYVPSEQGH